MNPLLALLLAVLAGAALKLLTVGKRERGLPPGPPTLPVLGNLHLLPTEYMYLRFTDWANQYGGFFSLKLSSGTFVSVNSVAAIKHVFDKRGATTSSRPDNHLSNLTSDGAYFVFLSSTTETFKRGRKAINLFTTTKNLDNHWPLQRSEGIQLLYDIKNTPQDMYAHIQRSTVSTMTSLLFGKRCPRPDDLTVKQFAEYIFKWSAILDPTANPPVDIIPILKWVPERWASWKTLCQEAKTLRFEMLSPFIEECRQLVKDGKAPDCWAAQVLSNQKAIGVDNNELLQLISAFMDAGSATTAAFLRTLIVTLIEFPECQKRAQVEIDTIIGNDRMPTLDDLKDLPYVQAMIKETLRYRPVIPMVPHANIQDEELMGYFVPKNSPMVLNIWGAMRDPDCFEQPERFMPERFLRSRTGVKAGAEEIRDNIVFGAGRRMCPGEKMGQRSAHLNTMNLLWAFHIEDDGFFSNRGVTPTHLSNFNKMGLELQPLPFTCKITLRAPERGVLIDSAYNAITN